MAAAAPELAPLSNYDFSRGAAAAVSGGSDSTALLLLLKSHFDQHHPSAPLLAVTVDHRLRPSSAAEARAVAELCASYGIAHRIMAWTGPKPATGLPAAARVARYRLLAAAAREAGLAVIVTGHTADDQAETVRMRQVRSRNLDAPGLAGMAPATLYDNTFWIVRPLLNVRRQALRALLRDADIGWSDDPTNLDTRFERPRLRLGADEDGVAQAMARAAHAAQCRQDLGRRAQTLLRAFARQPVPGLVGLSRGLFAAADREAAVHVLRVLLAVVGGTPFLPPKDAATVLFARLAGAGVRATLSRCVVDARPGAVYLHRERRGLPPPGRATEGMVWDGRRRVISTGNDAGLMIAARSEGHADGEDALSTDAPQSLWKAALAAEPVLWHEHGVAEAYGDGTAGRCAPVLAPWRFFLPSFDLALACAVADLIGAPPLPAPPFSRPTGVEPWSNA